MEIRIYWLQVAYILLAVPLTLFVHELGHLLAGFALGCKEPTIYLGRRSARWALRLDLGLFRLHLHPGLYLSDGGRCLFAHWPRMTPGKWLLFALSGPAAAALLCALAWGIDPPSLKGATAPETLTWWQVTGWFALANALFPLFPMRYRDGMTSDGLKTLRALRALIGGGDRP